MKFEFDEFLKYNLFLNQLLFIFNYIIALLFIYLFISIIN